MRDVRFLVICRPCRTGKENVLPISTRRPKRPPHDGAKRVLRRTQMHMGCRGEAMIWEGETLEQYEDRAEAGISTYAVFPTQMADGRWVWLQRYWASLHRGHSNNRWWVRAIDRNDCIPKPILGPPPTTR